MTPNLYQLTPAISDLKKTIFHFPHKNEMQLLYQVDFAKFTGTILDRPNHSFRSHFGG